MECLNCGQNNKEKALYCGLCGEVLIRKNMQGEEGDMIGLSYGAVPDRYDLKRRALCAHRFLIIILCMLLLPLILGVLRWNAQNQAIAQDPDHTGFPTAIQWLVIFVYCSIVYGYVISKMGESTGSPFWKNFPLACIPFMTPAIWARIGGRSMIKPYLYLFLDAAILAVAFYFFHSWPALIVILLFCLAPFLIYQLLGCSIGPMADSMGFYPSLTLGWLCLGPVMLMGILLWAILTSMNPEWTSQPLSISLDDIRNYIDLNQILDCEVFKISGAIYLLASFFIWIKATYENLKLPIV